MHAPAKMGHYANRPRCAPALERFALSNEALKMKLGSIARIAFARK